MNTTSQYMVSTVGVRRGRRVSPGQSDFKVHSCKIHYQNFITFNELIMLYCPGHQKLRVGGCTEEVLEWFNYPHVITSQKVEITIPCYKVNPHCEVSAVFISCSTWTLCCRWRMLRMRSLTGVSKPLMLNFMAPEAHKYLKKTTTPTCKIGGWALA